MASIASVIESLLHLESLPAVGLLAAAIFLLYVGFRKRIIRWGADVDAMTAELNRQILYRDAIIAKLEVNDDRWRDLNAVAVKTTQAVAEGEKKAVAVAGVVIEKIANGGR